MKKTTGFIIFIALLGIFACNKDTDDVTSDIFTQASAEEWFNSTFKKSEEWQQNAESQNKIPDWSNGSYLKKDGLEIFEFPLAENKATISVPADKTITSNETRKILDATLSRMVIIKTNTNEMMVRKLYYVPEYNYLLSKGYDISTVMFNKTNDDFTGLLITKKWNDEILSYHQVKNGKIKEMLIKYDENILKDNSLSSIKINNYSTAKTSGLGDEQNLDDVIVNNNYHAPVTYVYLPSQPYYPTSSSSYNPYGTGGGSGGGSSSSASSGVNNADCQNALNGLNRIIELSGPTSQLISTTKISESSNIVNNYKWKIFSGPGYALYSSETGVLKKVVNSNPTLQKEWVSLTHNAIYKEGIVAGGDISFTTIYAQPTIGKYNSLMALSYNVKFDYFFKGCPATNEGNYKGVHTFNVND